MTMAHINAMDRDALERCMAVAMRDPLRAEQLRSKLAGDAFSARVGAADPRWSGSPRQHPPPAIIEKCPPELSRR